MAGMNESMNLSVVDGYLLNVSTRVLDGTRHS